MKIFNYEGNIPVENIGQTQQFHIKHNGKSSSQEAAETPKIEEPCEQADNSASAGTIDGEKTQKDTQTTRSKKELLEDLLTYTHSAADDGDWDTAILGIKIEAELCGYLGNKVSQRPTGNIGEYDPSMEVLDAIIIDSDQTECEHQF